MQEALDDATCGDTIRLASGATFLGNFILPHKACAGWILIRTDIGDAHLPPAGTRITPAFAPVLAKILSDNASAAIYAPNSAHHYRIVGVELGVTSRPSLNYGIVYLGAGKQSQASELPHDIIFDRCYVHGNPEGSVRRGFALNGTFMAVIDSYVSELHEDGGESQAIVGWAGPGPFKIVNNYLEAASENIMFGGGTAAIRTLVPSDIEIRRNHFFKPLRWRREHPTFAGIAWPVKNHLELKNAQRVLIEGNVFENVWEHAQSGGSIVFTVRTEDGRMSEAVVQDVTFVKNIVRHAANGITVSGVDTGSPGDRQRLLRAKRILIKDNLFEDISERWGGRGMWLLVLNGPQDLTIDHNTAFPSKTVLFADGPWPGRGFTFRNNLMPHHWNGVAGSGKGIGIPGLEAYFPGYVFVRNVLVGKPAEFSYPRDNFFPSSFEKVKFADRAAGQYRLAAGSPYKKAGTDRKDIGADFDALEQATAGVVLQPGASSR